MTHAIYAICGAAKFDCILACKSCGQSSREPLDFAYSFALSDDYRDDNTLDRVRAHIREAGTVPGPRPGQEAMMLRITGNSAAPSGPGRGDHPAAVRPRRSPRRLA